MIRPVYLLPLRDAKRALASGNPSRIYALLSHFLGDEDPDELAKRLKRETDEQILKNIDMAVDEGLIALTAGVRRQAAALGFTDPAHKRCNIYKYFSVYQGMEKIDSRSSLCHCCLTEARSRGGQGTRIAPAPEPGSCSG
jgi:hypothetical protein